MVYLRSRVLLDGMERREAISSAVNFFSYKHGRGGHVKVAVLRSRSKNKSFSAPTLTPDKENKNNKK